MPTFSFIIMFIVSKFVHFKSTVKRHQDDIITPITLAKALSHLGARPFWTNFDRPTGYVKEDIIIIRLLSDVII